MDIQEIFNKIGFDPKMALFNGINFLIFLVIINKFVFGKVSKAFNERQKRIEESLKYAEEIDQVKADIDKKSDDIISQANQKANVIISQAEETAKKNADEIKENADKEIEVAKSKSKKDIEIERSKMIDELKLLAAGLTVEATEKILEEKITDEKDKKIIEKYLKGLDK